ncbi:MAG: SH3 domain-containing protein, partial [Gammaproteobacteria bacterium]|nr:SH3 domain-containing protein [Gammaproteobacteria bacterium]
SAFSEAMAFISKPSALENTLQMFAESGHILINEPNSISEMARSLSRVDIGTDALEIDVSLEESNKELSKAKDGKSFINTFRKLPPLIQVILFYVLINVFLPQVNSISANLLTPIVENYLKGNNAPDREKIKDIETMPSALLGVVTDDLIFITGNNVRVREKPSTKSKILDELMLGKVVTVLSRKRNWIEIMYICEDGDPVYGWVFARYTAEFVR